MRTDDIHSLPDDLPVPVDDGACRHLPGMAVPSMELISTSGSAVNLASMGTQRTIVYCYPRTGRPDQELPPGWNQIPGARGCTPESCGFRDLMKVFDSVGVRIFGLSTQTADYQREMVARLQLPFDVLSDSEFAFTNALGLPTFEVQSTPPMTLLKRLTLVLSAGRIEKVFYPIFPPDAHAAEVLAWLSSNPRR